jgi:hypothetical protein
MPSFAPCPTPGTVTGCQFTQQLVSQEPVYDKLILEDIRPEDGWILHVETGEFPAYSGVQHTLDRFNHVWPNVTKTWRPTQAGNCLGTPCDKTENYITWGATRLTYFLEEQSWATPLLCYDQDMHVTHAKEHFRQIITDILKPATSAINSNFLRKRAAQFAHYKWIANRNFGNPTTGQFNYEWVLAGTNSDEEWYIDTDVPASSLKKLTPQMLQSRFQPLCRYGYFGKQPFKDMPPNIELVTDMDTTWELDKLGGQQGIGGTPSIAGNWRFTEWDASTKYWKYAFAGSIGNYVVRADPFNLRFNYLGAIGTTPGLPYRYQVVLPFKNLASSGAGGAPGTRDIPNSDFDKALYRWTYIWHRKSLQCLVADATPVNPEMPFSSRNFGGRWQFVMDNLGADQNGLPIENKRRNKGMFIADFKMAIRPLYTEFLELIFHKAEPQCIIEIDTCASDPGYPAQNYESDTNISCTNTSAPYTLTLTPQRNATTTQYQVEANSIMCNGVPVDHSVINGTTTLALLVEQLNQLVGVLGTWAVSGANITLVGSCSTVTVPWILS